MTITFPKVERFLQEVDALFPVPLSQKQSLSSLAVKLCEKGTICAVWEEEEMVAMVAGYTEQVINGLAYISVVATRPAYQGTGLASRLIREFMAICRRKSLRGVHLYTVQTNTAAVAMYRRLGFTEWRLDNEPRKQDLHLIYYFEKEGEQP